MLCLSDYETKVYGWCDSTAVLGWIHGDPSRWKSFVANRVKQVTLTMPPDCWHYVKTTENPADCASRGISVEDLLNKNIWWHGPSWLSETTQQKLTTLTKKQLFTTVEELKKTKQTNLITKSNETDLISGLLYKHSNLDKATRILAWVLRALKHDSIKLPYLTIEEIRNAKLRFINYIQAIEFADELKSLKTKGKVESKSRLITLNPFLDKNNILRVGGRLNNANINIEMKHPIIIPHSGRLTELLINQAHNLTFHGGAKITNAFLRQKYWILGSNRVVKKQIRQCITCRKHNPDKHYQLMGDLPSSRSNPSRPFDHTGVDFTGHFFIKISSGRAIRCTKGYVAVFVCMATKAVHLELVSDMTTSAFLAALRRFSARRGKPSNMYSDNGKNFVGANSKLKQEYEELEQIFNQEFLTEITEMEVKWHFNAPLWPSAGGLWESAVKSLKHHLKRVVGDQKLSFEEFSTLLSQLEACLNSRPLCPLSEDPEDINALTPSHFLASGPTLTLCETEYDLRTRWTHTQKIFQDIWKKWKSEYLTLLHNRSKWTDTKPNININDIVMIHDANLPPGKWALGRVVDLHPGKDQLVRVVTLKTKNGLLKRPITKVSLLPVNETDNKQNDNKQNDNKQNLGKTNTNKIKTIYTKNILSTLLLSIIIFLNIITTT